MTTTKRRGTKGSAVGGTSLEQRAKEAEQALRRQGVKLPPAKPLANRKVRGAEKVHAALDDDDDASDTYADAARDAPAKTAEDRVRSDDARGAERRALDRIADRARKPRRRTPAGLQELAWVRDGNVLRGPNPGEAPTYVEDVRAEYRSSMEAVTPELAAQAQALRKLLDVEAWDPKGKSGLSQTAPRTRLRREHADALRAAVALLRNAWISLVLERLEDAALAHPNDPAPHAQITASKLNDARREIRVAAAGKTTATINRSILRKDIAEGCRTTHLTELPEYVTAEVIVWVADKLSFARGGGKTGKLSRDALAALLADQSKLVKVMAAKPRRK